MGTTRNFEAGKPYLGSHPQPNNHRNHRNHPWEPPVTLKPGNPTWAAIRKPTTIGTIGTIHGNRP